MPYPEWSAWITPVLSGASAIISGMVLGNSIHVERRNKYRELVTSHLPALSDALHEIMASCHIRVERAKLGQSSLTYKNRAADAANKLKRVRIQVRLPLKRIDAGINVMTRLPSWIDHKVSSPNKARELLDAAEELRLLLDDALLGAIINGKEPSWRMGKAVERAVDKVEQRWKVT
jgi:hypothetical protein